MLKFVRHDEYDLVNQDVQKYSAGRFGDYGSGRSKIVRFAESSTISQDLGNGRVTEYKRGGEGVLTRRLAQSVRVSKCDENGCTARIQSYVSTS